MKTTSDLKEIAEKYGIPERINLYTRQNKCETVLDFVGFIDFEKCPEFNYRYSASYPYQIQTEGEEVISIDFSEGPTLMLGSKIKVKKIELEVIEIYTPDNLIVFKKI